MKRTIYILLILLLLSGCVNIESGTTSTNIATTILPSSVSTAPETLPTEPSIPWIERDGTSWDENGILLGLPLELPQEHNYTSVIKYDGDLLLWGKETLEDKSILHMCLVELDTGVVSAEKSLEFASTAIPQILGKMMYLCDRNTGTILELDKTLEIKQQWSIEPCEAYLVMGANGILYKQERYGFVYKINLQSGVQEKILEDAQYIKSFVQQEDVVHIAYIRASDDESVKAVLDLETGQLLAAPVEEAFQSIHYCDGTWLCESYEEGYMAYVGTSAADFLQAPLANDYLKLIDRNTLLRVWEDGCTVSLHDLTGTTISKAVLTEPYNSYTITELILSETFGGYFAIARDPDANFHLLYWDTAIDSESADIPFAPIPKPGEMESAIYSRIDQIEAEYGLKILVGKDTETSFLFFDTVHFTDWEEIDIALDSLESALCNYPEGFFRQFRNGVNRGVEIQFVGALTPTDQQYTDTYVAFVQNEYDRHLMIVDTITASQQTFYHEFAHVIDAFLERDAQTREDALFSEEAWNALNPAWFPGYSFNYAEKIELQDTGSFVDSYSTIKPTEDRARIMEYAMLQYGSMVFLEDTILARKLEYYSRCIRDAFHTEGWPETVLWEQHI